jgi:hypothetical protein
MGHIVEAVVIAAFESCFHFLKEWNLSKWKY